MRTRRLLAALVVLAAPTLLQRAFAETRPSARLEYARKGGATACADEPLVRDAVAARLGYDPFQPDAERVIKVTVTRDAAGFHAVIEEGDRVRRLDSKAKDCADLSSSIAVSLATAIDPLGIGATLPQASTSTSTSASVVKIVPPPRPTASATKPAASASDTPTSRPPAFVATVGGHAAFGAAPDLAFGLTTGVGIRWTAFSLGIEGRVDGETRGSGPQGGEVKSSILAASLLPCVHLDPVYGCAVATFGALRGAGGAVGSPRRASTFYSAAGVRVGFEVPIAGPFTLRLHGDVLATLTKTTLYVQDAEAWTTPTIHGLAGLEIAGIFR